MLYKWNSSTFCHNRLTMNVLCSTVTAGLYASLHSICSQIWLLQLNINSVTTVTSTQTFKLRPYLDTYIFPHNCTQFHCLLFVFCLIWFILWFPHFTHDADSIRDHCLSGIVNFALFLHYAHFCLHFQSEYVGNRLPLHMLYMYVYFTKSQCQLT